VLPAALKPGAKGYLYESNRDEILSKAKKEGALRGLLGIEPDAIKAVKESFSKKYPFIKTYFANAGAISKRRFLLAVTVEPVWRSCAKVEWELRKTPGRYNQEPRH
jgi:hypothetical protein